MWLALLLLLAAATAPATLRFVLDLDGPLVADNAFLRQRLREASVRIAALEAELASGELVPKSKLQVLRDRCMALAADLLERNVSTALRTQEQVQQSYAKGLADGEQKKQCAPLEPAYQRGLEAGKASCHTKCPPPTSCLTAAPKRVLPPAATVGVSTRPETALPARKKETRRPLQLYVDSSDRELGNGEKEEQVESKVGLSIREDEDTVDATMDPLPPPPKQQLLVRHPPPTSPPRGDCLHAYEFGIDRVGGSLLSEISVSSGLRCKKSCAQRGADCRAWSFATSSGVCRLLGTIGHDIETEGIVSGIMC